MMLPESLRHLGEKLQHGWQHLPLRGLGIMSAALPMVAVVFSAVMAFAGNQQRGRMETAVTRHFQMVERLGDLLTHLLDAETGLRGHLLTAGRAEFLAPYEQATRSLPVELDTLRDFTRGEPGEGPRRDKLTRLENIRGTVERELTLLGELRALPPNPGGGNGEGGPLVTLLGRSKATMDTLRDQLREMRGEEQRLLAARLAEIRRVRRRDYLTIALALLLGLATRGAVFYFFNRRVVRRVEALTANAHALRAGQPPPHAPSDHRDAIGDLERALAGLAAPPATR